MPTKPTFVDPYKVTGSTKQIITRLLKLKPKDFPDEDQALDLIRRLKADADQGEMRLIAYLTAYEKSELWKKSAVQCHTFNGWLKYYQTSLPDVSRYNNGKEALLEFGVEACLVYSIRALSKVVSLPKVHRHTFVKEELEPGVETRRFPLSDVTVGSRVKEYRKAHGLVSNVPRNPKSDLATQLDEARERICQLKEEVRELKKERDDLKKRLAEYDPQNLITKKPVPRTSKVSRKAA